MKAIGLLQHIANGLVEYRAIGSNSYDTKVTIDLPEPAFGSFLHEMKEVYAGVDAVDIKYAGFSFCVRKIQPK